MNEMDECEWVKRHCPIGCRHPDEWNKGCWVCEERYGFFEADVPCKGWFDSIDALVEKTVGSMPWKTADVPTEINGRRVKEECTVVLLGSVRSGVKPLAEELLRSRLRPCEVDEDGMCTVCHHEIASEVVGDNETVYAKFCGECGAKVVER